MSMPRAAEARGVSAGDPLDLRAAAMFALAYALLSVLGRMTVVPGQTLALIWPAGGVAALWLLAESERHQARVLVPLVVIHFAMLTLSGAHGLAVYGSIAVALQTWIFVALLRRYCPTLLGAGGTESLRTPVVVMRTAAAALCAAAGGAVVGTLGIWVSGEGDPGWEAIAWLARYSAGLLAVGCVGHLAWEWRTQHPPRRVHGGSTREFVALWVGAILATVVLFSQPLPLEFLAVIFSLWAAARFQTFPASVLCLVIGVIGLVQTLRGHGSFDSIADPVAAALVCQIFIVTMIGTGLMGGALADRIDSLYADAESARRQESKQAQLLAEMTESMSESLILLDGEGRIERSNAASRRLARRLTLGASDEVALARLVDLCLSAEGAATAESRAELDVGDVVIELESGEEVILAVNSTPLSAPVTGRREEGVLLVIHEVTDHRTGLRPLANFAATAAHDLRGPLTSVRSWLSLAAEDLDEESAVLAALRRAERGAGQMGDLIGDLLAHAVAESGALSPVDLELGGPDGVFTQAAELLGPADVLELPEDLPAVHADRLAIRQLVGNLLGNAVKYAKPGQPAYVQVSAVRCGARVVIDIRDNGVGVEEDERTVIFQRFHRSGAVRASFRGTGMGLSICQSIVQRHGGTIECLATPPGGGSVFRFDLPVAGSG